jgi:hypothetical protein
MWREACYQNVLCARVLFPSNLLSSLFDRLAVGVHCHRRLRSIVPSLHSSLYMGRELVEDVNCLSCCDLKTPILR